MSDKKSIANTAKTVYNVYKWSDAKKPRKTDNFMVDWAVGRNKYVKAWDIGFNVGKAAFIAEQSIKELKKK